VQDCGGHQTKDRQQTLNVSCRYTLGRIKKKSYSESNSLNIITKILEKIQDTYDFKALVF